MRGMLRGLGSLYQEWSTSRAGRLITEHPDPREKDHETSNHILTLFQTHEHRRYHSSRAQQPPHPSYPQSDIRRHENNDLPLP